MICHDIRSYDLVVHKSDIITNTCDPIEEVSIAFWAVNNASLKLPPKEAMAILNIKNAMTTMLVTLVRLHSVSIASIEPEKWAPAKEAMSVTRQTAKRAMRLIDKCSPSILSTVLEEPISSYVAWMQLATRYCDELYLCILDQMVEEVHIDTNNLGALSPRYADCFEDGKINKKKRQDCPFGKSRYA